MSSFQLGWIEGFYGKPWSREQRHAMVGHLSAQGYRMYFYAPKADHALRRDWRKPCSQEQLREFSKLIETCREASVEFGIGLTPLEFHLSSQDEAWADLRAKIESFNALGIDRLAILFDDMRGDVPELAKRQAGILHRIRDFSRAKSLCMCPTYYSPDPVLDRVFGARPERYLEDLGRELEPSIGIFWTGEKICAKAQNPAQLAAVGELLRRKPMLWDNYPVNDTPKMCKFLHLRAFQARPAELSGVLEAHVINPMNEPELSRIPAETLAMSYGQAESYSPAQAFSDAAREICGEELAALLSRDLSIFEDGGLDSLSEEEKRGLIGEYEKFAHPTAREVVSWLRGEYLVTLEQIQETHGLA